MPNTESECAALAHSLSSWKGVEVTMPCRARRPRAHAPTRPRAHAPTRPRAHGLGGAHTIKEQCLNRFPGNIGPRLVVYVTSRRYEKELAFKDSQRLKQGNR